MSANKRIAMNFIATYGRSLYSLCLGLFSARWVLLALGQSDFGLWGVVGSIIVVISCLNGILGGAVSRYYAFAIGEAHKNGEGENSENIVKWFNVAISIHFLVPVVLCVIGLPLGIYAIRNWLVIPDGRLTACEVVFCLSLLTAFINMISVPYIAFYRAKQLIVELSIWEMARATILFIGAYWLLRIDSDRLIAYALIMTFVPCSIIVAQMIRAQRTFGVCHIKREYLFDRAYIRELLAYSMWEFFASFGDVIRSQGTAFLINRNFGTTVNAAWSVSSQVSSQTTAMSSALIGAVTPALTTAAGAGDNARVSSLAFAASKYGSFFIGIFAIPLILEMDNVLSIWLVNPPQYAAVLCRCILIALICHKIGYGHHMSVLAHGKVAGLLSTTGLISSGSVFLVAAMIRLGLGPLGVGLAFVISYSALSVARVYWARRLIGLSVAYCLLHIVMPVAVTLSVSFLAGRIVVSLLPETLWRVFVSAATTSMVSLTVGWFFVCSDGERAKAIQVAFNLKKRLLH